SELLAEGLAHLGQEEGIEAQLEEGSLAVEFLCGNSGEFGQDRAEGRGDGITTAGRSRRAHRGDWFCRDRSRFRPRQGLDRRCRSKRFRIDPMALALKGIGWQG